MKKRFFERIRQLLKDEGMSDFLLSTEGSNIVIIGDVFSYNLITKIKISSLVIMQQENRLVVGSIILDNVAKVKIIIYNDLKNIK